MLIYIKHYVSIHYKNQISTEKIKMFNVYILVIRIVGLNT